MLDDLKIFITAAQTKSLTATAEKLGMTIATVSRRIANLENTLGSVLLHRSTKGLTLTTTGASYYRECAEFIEALDQRISDLDSTLNSLEGEVKILAPTNLGAGPLDEFWPLFAIKYPQISLRIELSNDFQSLQDTQADLALRSGQSSNQSLIQRKVGEIQGILVASPSLSPFPETIEQLEQTQSVAGQLFNEWHLIHDASGAEQTIDKPHRHTCNDMRISVNLVKHGHEVTFLPESLVYDEIQAGQLKRVLPEWRGRSREIYVVWPYRRSLSVRATLVRDELMAFLHSQAWFKPS
ncbi:HTH-type transcriptional regulator DmlR [Marinomonas gallaica]|uniref:HTH-type transcriptional regulator DmlR n=1 Tax=Marinomonas gallaica TaxID=1806667 RepID=A0A1C3JR96_9GAMM|nr:LysR family transcriptional regulator [Marinomonas gallaica]SBT17748.1 HTH-type transcriptional regulator DmlR [Marinomonas gallaica]SBT20074.1 HTH-type transcriptional regulator DmlR [Marinomonas gallaica]